MDWSRTELQEAIDELAPQILADDEPWAALVEAELLGELGLLEICSLLVRVGEAGARVPVLETLLMGSPLRRAGVDLPADAVLTAGLMEPEQADPRRAQTTVKEGRAYGEKMCVPAVDRASWMVVPATDGLWGVRLADAVVVAQEGTDGDALGWVKLDGVPAVFLADRDAMERWLQHIEVGICALLYGLSRTALKLTAKYTTDREQFGRAIGTFQAVAHRAADAWIDRWAMELTLWQAAWRLEEGRPCARELAIARHVACEGAHQVTAAAQHLHGGMGFDKDYPLYRYFLAVKQWEFVLGGASEQLERIGGMIAASAAAAEDAAR